MLPSVIASGLAATDLGYPGVGQIIVEWQLSPHAIVRMFSLSAAHDLGMTCAIVLIAGSTARFNVCRKGWDGELERMLAMHELERHATRSDGNAAAGRSRIANREAVKLVNLHWAEITAEGYGLQRGGCLTGGGDRRPLLGLPPHTGASTYLYNPTELARSQRSDVI